MIKPQQENGREAEEEYNCTLNHSLAQSTERVTEQIYYNNHEFQQKYK